MIGADAHQAAPRAVAPYGPVKQHLFGARYHRRRLVRIHAEPSMSTAAGDDTAEGRHPNTHSARSGLVEGVQVPTTG